jgi:hypothetical protein
VTDLSSPPPLPFVLSVGVTGHRLDALPAGSVETLKARVREVLGEIERAVHRVLETNGGYFAAQPPRLVFISPIADGADQIVAEVAVSMGYELRVVMPSALDDYRKELLDGAARERFDRLVDAAASRFELPGDAGRLDHGYVMAGRATVAHCDILLAVWDGLPARGRGGTAEVVSLALSRGAPVVHLSSTPGKPPMLRWAAFDPTVVTDRDEPTIERPFEQDNVDRLVEALVAPPPDPRERVYAERYQAERNRRWKVRIEYPLLLAFAGIKRIGPGAWKAQRCSEYTRKEWQAYREACADRHGVGAPIDRIETWYDWADRLAGHVAQSYRSGHVFNFLLGAAAVLLALTTMVVPKAKVALAIGEFLAVVAILANTSIGTRQEWHRKWLDYRQLAERLRPMRSLKLLGIAAPDPPGTAANPVARRWVEWYSAAVWRATGCPTGRLDAKTADSLAISIAEHEVAPQIAYHRATSIQVERLDHRLEKLGTALFAASLFSCAFLLIAFAVSHSWVERHSDWFVMISAGLPAIGTAIFGIRFQGDFGGSAVRSQSTADRLDLIVGELRTPRLGLSRTADLVEEAARAMLSDLDEWQLVNQQRDLSI